MRNLASSFTMRKDGVLPRGDWFSIQNKADDSPAQVYIYDEIGFWGTEASDFVTQLVELNADKIDLHLNSPGGEIFDGLAIYNALKQNKAEVTVYVDGLAASAASFIAQAGDKVVMARNAQMMIHDGIAMAYGNEQDMLDTADLLSKLSNNIADIYSQSAKKRGFDDSYTEEYYRGLMRAELWMNGKEALEFGLADEVTDSDDEEAEKAKNKWDLSFYNAAGREKAESPTRVAARLMLSNNQKEKSMGAKAPKNEGGDQPADTPTETGQPTGDPSEEGTEVVPTDDPQEPNETITGTQPAESGQASGDPVVTTPENRAGQQGVLINGKLETDWTVINRHFASLNAAQEEQRTTFRKNFVEGLAASNKIPAPMIDSLVELVNGNGTNLPAMSDEQFAAFQASYESAPASTLFENHATTQSGQSGQTQGTSLPPNERQERVNVLEGIVAMHRRTMPEDQVKQTKSYVELQSLLGNNES